jgi:hypothetical protein
MICVLKRKAVWLDLSKGTYHLLVDQINGQYSWKSIATARLQGVLSCNLPILENISGESVSDGVLGT